jgi:hypothetical protein
VPVEDVVLPPPFHRAADDCRPFDRTSAKRTRVSFHDIGFRHFDNPQGRRKRYRTFEEE